MYQDSRFLRALLNKMKFEIPRFPGVRLGDEWLCVIQSLELPCLALRDDAGQMDALWAIPLSPPQHGSSPGVTF